MNDSSGLKRLSITATPSSSSSSGNSEKTVWGAAAVPTMVGSSSMATLLLSNIDMNNHYYTASAPAIHLMVQTYKITGDLRLPCQPIPTANCLAHLWKLILFHELRDELTGQATFPQVLSAGCRPIQLWVRLRQSLLRLEGFLHGCRTLLMQYDVWIGTDHP